MVVFPRIEIWSTYRGFAPGNDLASQIEQLLSDNRPDLGSEGFKVISLEWADLSPQRREFEGTELRVLLLRFRCLIYQQ